MIENNEDNREKLAREIIEGWDLDTLIDTAVDNLCEHYKENPNEFKREWEQYYPE